MSNNVLAPFSIAIKMVDSLFLRFLTIPDNNKLDVRQFNLSVYLFYKFFENDNLIDIYLRQHQ